MDYPRYKPARSRPLGRGALFDYAASVLNAPAPLPKRGRGYRGHKAVVLPLAKDKAET